MGWYEHYILDCFLSLMFHLLPDFCSEIWLGSPRCCTHWSREKNARSVTRWTTNPCKKEKLLYEVLFSPSSWFLSGVWVPIWEFTLKILSVMTVGRYKPCFLVLSFVILLIQKWPNKHIYSSQKFSDKPYLKNHINHRHTDEAYKQKTNVSSLSSSISHFHFIFL